MTQVPQTLWIPESARSANGNGSGKYKKADPPKTGPAYGQWSGRDIAYATLPGGAVLQFDLNALTLADFRVMRDHPQINASLCVLSFMMHQLDWWIECDNQKIATLIEDNLRETWTRLIRALSQSYWAGFSPIVTEYENDVQKGAVVITKFKDLIPEECRVHWKEVEGYAPPGRVPPKFKIYDGIDQYGSPTIPIENTLWYPLLMENGNYYGRKLLRPAFAPWYFSTLIHLFANRYYERYGEPLPVGRAPFDADIEIEGGESISGKAAMEGILSNLRNRGVVVLPSDRMPVGNTSEWEYDISYLESQMRGADFERYLGRLDEEMSLGIFTPVLLFRTADVGSYNLGVGHMQLFMWMLNALAGDLKEYIDKYVVRRLKDFNFGPNAPIAQWQFRKMGKENTETTRAVLQELIRQDRATVDLEELGMIAGLTVEEITQLVDPVTGKTRRKGDPVDQEAVKRHEEEKQIQEEERKAAAEERKQRAADTRKRDRNGVGNGPKKVGQPRPSTKGIS